MDINTIGLLVAFGGSCAWFWYDKKRNDTETANFKKSLVEREAKTKEHIYNELKLLENKLNELNLTIVTHNNIHVTEEKSRKIAEDVCSRIESDVNETKTMVKALVSQVSQLASNLQSHTAVHSMLEKMSKNRNNDN